MLRELFDKLNTLLGIKTPVKVPYRVAPSYEFNREGLEIIKRFEGFYPNAYLCPAGVPTIGYGTTVYPEGIKVKLGDIRTQEQAEYLLMLDIIKIQNKIAPYLRSINAELSSNEYSALVSLAYNVGEGVILNTARSMNKAIRSGSKEAMAGAFLLYNKAGGKVLAGLVRRREAERALFLKV
jgi:lysozyme